MNDIIIVPSKNNKPTRVYSKRCLFDYTCTESIILQDDVDYFHCYLVSDSTILSGDACIVTDPDGNCFPEVCAEVILVGISKVFYGKVGTRCLLCDVQKITATTNAVFLSQHISPLSGEEIQSLLKQRKLKYSVPNFYNE